MKLEYLERAASSIEEGLKGNCKGYAFVVCYKDEWKVKGAGGWARLNADPPKREMDTSVPFTLASVSKVITAAAMIRALTKKGIKLDTPFHTYLPKHWSVHDSIKYVTFKDIMEHRSGFRFGGDGETYLDIKHNMFKGCNMSLRGQVDYSNHNYDVMRLLIPAVAGYDIPQYKKNPGAAELMQAAMYAGFYVTYIQKEVFAPAGIGNPESISCKALPFVTGKDG
jgi:CubicO group peptidase (beta-lactamase class C family)